MKLSASTKNTVQLIVSYLFIILFVYAAVSKLLEFQDFQTQLGQSPLLGAYAIMISYGVIISELTISVLLIFEKSRRTGLFASFTLMVMFTAYIIMILNFTSFTPCSCGGVLESLGWTEHLIFNIAFIGLALIVLYKKSALKILIFLFVSGILFVTGLFLFSEKEIKRNNAFQRKYMPHALEELGSYQLESNAFYFAGIDDSLIYLGNYNAPLYLKAVSKDFRKSKEIKIELDNYSFPYKRVRVEVHSPYFYVMDGTVPVISRGEISDWKAEIFSFGAAYFYDMKVQDSSQLVFTTTSSKTGYTVLGQLKKGEDSTYVNLNHELLKVQKDGKFDTDGFLLWDSENNRTVYVYYYRNQYEVADFILKKLRTGKTIDTISNPQIAFAYYKGEEAFKKGKSTIVNKAGAVFGNHLYINSDRLGKYESEDALRTAFIIDEYHISRDEYLQSFYFYHQKGQKLHEFKVIRDTIIAIVDDQLWSQKIKTEYYQKD